MKPTLVDSNILLDLATGDPNWSEWSATALERVADEGIIGINPIVYAEVSVYASSMEALDESLEGFEYWPIPKEAGFLAGKVFGQYRRSGGNRSSPLPDLYIGAHAMVLGCRILTRDVRRFRTYYPQLDLIAPD